MSFHLLDRGSSLARVGHRARDAPRHGPPAPRGRSGEMSTAGARTCEDARERAACCAHHGAAASSGDEADIRTATEWRRTRYESLRRPAHAGCAPGGRGRAGLPPARCAHSACSRKASSFDGQASTLAAQRPCARWGHTAGTTRTVPAGTRWDLYVCAGDGRPRARCVLRSGGRMTSIPCGVVWGRTGAAALAVVRALCCSRRAWDGRACGLRARATRGQLAGAGRAGVVADTALGLQSGSGGPAPVGGRGWALRELSSGVRESAAGRAALAALEWYARPAVAYIRMSVWVDMEEAAARGRVRSVGKLQRWERGGGRRRRPRIARL